MEYANLMQMRVLFGKGPWGFLLTVALERFGEFLIVVVYVRRVVFTQFKRAF